MIALVDHPIDVGSVRDAVAHPSCGCVLVFEGTTRDTFDGRRVVRLEYEAYAAMALAELRAIADEIAERWPGVRTALVHRTGLVPVGETSVVIAVAAPHRDAGYAASRYALETLKARVPIWKREVYEDGSAWKANG